MSVTIDGDRLTVAFDRFGIEEYPLFLKVKRLPESVTEFVPETETYRVHAPARFAPMLGVELPKVSAQDLPVAAHLFEDQRAVLGMALDAKRFAAWCACGWGKTPLGWEWARHVCHRTGGRVLVVTLAEIVPQWLEEAAKFYGDTLPVIRLRSREHMKEWCASGPGNLAITNYEKWNPESLDRQVVSEARSLAGIVLDEASRLKAGGGKQKWALIKSCRGIEYKLALTATPAPNDVMEFASQASFLEKMRSDGEILWTFFRRDETTHRWTVKPHAREPFFEFMAGWSIYVQDPRRYGWRKDFPEVPEPVTILRPVEPTPEQRALVTAATADAKGQPTLFPEAAQKNFVAAGRLSQIAKGFRYRRDKTFERIPSLKPAVVADIAADEEGRGAQVLVWTVYDAESTILAECLTARGVAFEALTGKTAKPRRLEILERFRRGETRVLVSRPSMLGWGMNFQFVSAMVFSGFSFSFEQWYQAVRRAYRYLQTQRLRIYVPYVDGLENDMLEAQDRKAAEHVASVAEMEACYVRARQALGGFAA